MATPRLNERLIAELRVPDGAREAWLSDDIVRGLRLRATAGGARTFYVGWTDPHSGERRRLRLGAWGALTLEQARRAARAVLGRVALGDDPLAERRRARIEASVSIATLIDEWAALHLAQRRQGYAREATRALRAALAVHLHRPAASLDRDTASRVIDGLALAGKPGAAGRALAYARACFGWAMKRGRVAMNPFAGLPAPPGAREARSRVLDAADLGMVWRAAGTQSPPNGQAVRFLMLTLARRDEAARMTWAEVAPDLSAWTLPAARSKNARPHVVHLAPAARAILRALLRFGLRDDEPDPAPVPERLVFAVLPRGGPISGWNWIKRRLDTAIATECAEAGRAPPAPWVLHDFRRSGVTWLAGAGFPPHV